MSKYRREETTIKELLRLLNRNYNKRVMVEVLNEGDEPEVSGSGKYNKHVVLYANNFFHEVNYTIIIGFLGKPQKMIFNYDIEENYIEKVISELVGFKPVKYIIHYPIERAG